MSVYLINSDTELDGDGNQGQQTPTSSEASAALNNFWPTCTEEIKQIENVSHLDVRTQALPLARIKKIMKLDEDVKMISAEAPVLFAKAAELFIRELTLRSWVHTEDNKRRTLQRNDIAMAISKYDQFDFLIDIVPRDEAKPPQTSGNAVRAPGMSLDQVHYYFQLQQQQQQQQQQNVVAQIPVEDKTLQNIQLVQQVVGSNGDIQHIPITLSQAQMQMIRMQLQANPGGQPVLVQTPGAQQVLQVSQGQGQSTGQQVFIQTNSSQDN